jgi:hypothetical protein
VKIPATLQPLIDSTRREVPSLLKQLQIGQVVQAKVLSQLRPGLLRLQMGATELLARSRVGIAPDTRLNLEVVKGHPLPELRILRQPTQRERQQLAVRSAMARQMSATEVRQALGTLRVQASSTHHAEAVRQLSAILQAAGVRAGRLTAVQLQRAITHSGIFHEAHLAAGMAAGATDTKARLLQLLSVFNEYARAAHKTGEAAQSASERQAGAPDPAGDSLLNRLIRLIEGSVSRIQLQQAAALPVEEGQRQAWQLDLPIQLPGEDHDAMLRIEREAAKDGQDDAPAWAVNLAFQFDTIGTLQCRIALAGERVSATFWCDRAATHERVERRLPVLQEAFEAQGLEVMHLAGVVGQPPEPLLRVPMPDVLLDERA